MKKIFTFLLVAISLSSVSQTSYYVNDSYNALTDVFTTANGSDLNTGTAAAPFATLNKAISVAIANDIIYIDAGTYTTGAAINISLTIRGANYLISPNAVADPLLPNGSRVAETIISNASFDIAASNVNIVGITFDPLTNFAIKQTNTASDFDNINISRNIFRNKSDNRSIQIFGKFQIPLVTFNCFITDNRFIKDVSNGGTAIIIAGINNVQILNNTFTISTDDAIRKQSDINLGTFRSDNVVISNNTAYRQFLFYNGIDALNTRIDYNKATECQRFVFVNNTLNDPCVVDISDNMVTDPKGSSPTISFQKNNGSDLSSPNIARIERNIVTLNGTGLNALPPAIITANLGALSKNSQVFIRDNKLSFSGNLSLSTTNDASAFITGIRFLDNSWQAVVERNEIEFNATNYNAINKSGIYIVHSFLQPGTNFDILNNKVSGFPTSLAIQLDHPGASGVGDFGQLPDGVSVNVHNNSFTNDVLSINNGTQSQWVNASCNWYGSAAAQNFIDKLTLPTVDVGSWLTNGTDNNVATGFQPMPDVCDGYPTVVTLDVYTDVTCNGANNGTINITASYGKAPTVFTWTKDGDPGFISHDEDPANLSPGTYHLVLVDGNGSNLYLTAVDADGPGTIDLTIDEPTVLTTTASGTNNLCFGQSSGTASVLTSGGTEPYSYLWSNAETTDAIDNLLAGNYFVTVTDANGCTTNANYTVTQPSQLSAETTGTSTACANSATVEGSGGTTPYSYLWDNGATTQSINSIPAGTYSVTITDAHGCQTTANTSVTANEAFNPAASVSDVTCFGGNTGSITVTNVNATAPFLFSIDGVNFQPGSLPYTFSNLTAGTYTISVKDNNGCTGFVTKTMAQPPLLSATINTIQNSCYGQNNGSVSINVTGGTGALSYSWTGLNGYISAQKNISGLAAGPYTLTVTDNNGCTSILNVVVSSYNEIIVSAVVTNVQCRGTLTGAIDLSVSGGSNSSFTFSWTGNIISTNEDLSNLGAGSNYNVAITDIGSGCVVTRSYAITQPSSNLSLSTTKTNSTGCNSLGTITATGSGGTPSYQYSINGDDYGPGLFTGLIGGNYTVWVKDANGCTTSKAVTLTDNGSDQYESNNSRNKAAAISTGTTIYGRIALSTDLADCFKFITGSAGVYTVMLTHPSASFAFDLYSSTNGSALVPISSDIVGYSTSKQYNLNGNTTYYLSITGGLSYKCYQLTVSTGSPLKSTGTNLQMEVVNKSIGKDIFDVKVSGNPSHTSFILTVISSSDENVNLKVMDISGRLIENRTNLSAAKTLQVGDRYIKGIYLAEIIQGRKRKVVKLVKL